MTQLRSLRELRVEYGISQERLAAALGVTSVSVLSWEKLRSRPRDNYIEQMAEIFSVKPEEIELAPQRARGIQVGYVFSEETRERMRQAALARYNPPEPNGTSEVSG